MKKIVLVLSLVLLVASPALAEQKIGYVDLQKALNLSSTGEIAKQKIAEKFKSYETKITSQQEELQKLKDELEKQAMMLSESKRAEKERDYQQKLKDFQRFTKDAQEELQQQDAEFTRAIIGDLVEVIKEVGKREGYSMILEQTESSIIFADKDVDITKTVIDQYNATNKNSE